MGVLLVLPEVCTVQSGGRRIAGRIDGWDGVTLDMDNIPAGGAVVYDDGLFLYSHHATDPCGG